ncbi:hypothetical protein SAY87_020563 [Trapa incisa]|uniref:TPX2 central domain-containing protein n=1 Tax=Trapa incisa TaxID=236973 RepID=A0AAN7JQI8_9MYRT|nr:hypothetical protein SAY87_020563 [Trapa incisa]
MEDEEMEVEEFYVVHEIDLDYEYDAPWYFDFTREESPTEATQVERWFESAKSYPPSPFVANLFSRDKILLGNAIASLNNESGGSREACQVIQGEMRDHMRLAGGIFGIMQSEGLPDTTNHRTGLNKGSGFCTRELSGKMITKAKNSIKSRSSTLMKPTACMLAKQNKLSQVSSSRSNMLHGRSKDRIMCTYDTESHAAKRQKIEGGHVMKAIEAKQPINFIHKAPKNDGIIDRTPHAKLRITIPREPDLETAQRAQRTKPKNSDKFDGSTVVRRFKARPLNRKILDAPQFPLSQKSTPRLPEFQLFHLKTSERAMQHTYASSSAYSNESKKELSNNDGHSVQENGNNGAGRISLLGLSRKEGSHLFNFKAHPLNKKVLSSKGDLGIFRNTKRGTTVPIEFSFHTENRTEHDLPIELFNKLSLKPDLQESSGSHAHPMVASRLPCLPVKGSKENRASSLPHKNEVARSLKEKPIPFRLRQFSYVNQEPTTAADSRMSLRY